MGDHDYTSEDPEKNVCKEENSCSEAPEVVINDPLVISGKPNQVNGKDLKSEIIKEFNQFLTEEEKLEELNELLASNYEEKDPRVHYSLGRSFIFAVKTVTIDVVETNQYDIHIGDEITVEDKRTVRFKYAHTATRYNRIRIKVFCEGDSSHHLIFRLKDKEKILEKNVPANVEYSCVLDKTTQSGIYIISIWAINKISASIKVRKEDVLDTLIDERGAIWVNQDDIESEQLFDIESGQLLFNNLPLKYYKLRWYLPKEYVGILLGVLERKINGQSDDAIRKAYDSGIMSIVSVGLSLMSLFVRKGIVHVLLFLGGAAITVADPEEVYNKLYWKVDEVTGRHREGPQEVFSNGCILELYDYYDITPDKKNNTKLKKESNLVSIYPWENSQETMKGMLGCKGKFIINNSPDSSEEFAKFSI